MAANVAGRLNAFHPDISSVRFTHAGFWVEDLDKMADFYQRFFKCTDQIMEKSMRTACELS